MRSLVFVLVVAACGGQSAKQQPTVQAPAAKSDPTCPLVVAGTSVSVEDTNDGAALVFVTTGNALEVQQRADAFVAAHDTPTASGFAAMVGHGDKVSAQHIDHGAKLVFTASDPAAVQSELRMHANHLSAGSCEMAM